MKAALFFLLMFSLFVSGASAADWLVSGDSATDVRLPYATADSIYFKALDLSEAVRNGPVVLAFYPADWSPGCTTEVCALRDAFADLEALHVTVWMISGDTVFSHKAWAEHHHLPFPLLSDTKHTVSKAYGAFNEESGLNRRAVYVVGKAMRVIYSDPDYSVKDDTDFKALKEALGHLPS